MEHVTPGQLFFGVGGGLAIVITIMVLHACWPEIAAIGRAAWARAMSSSAGAPAADAGMNAVYIPVSQYGMDAGGMDDGARAAPDMDAPNAGMPRALRDITSDELIVLLAVLRGADKKPRYSANAIHALVGGDRNTVLAKVKEIRSGPAEPVFPPLTDEQQRLRRQLQLDQR